jgi:hypothetical protein
MPTPNALMKGEEREHAGEHEQRASCGQRHGLVRLRQRNTHEEDDGAHIEENKVQRRQSAHRKGREGAVEQPEHHHRGKSDQVDMGIADAPARSAR